MNRTLAAAVVATTAVVVLLLRRRRPRARLLNRAASTGLERYGAFVSHFKAEAAMEARYLQKELESALGKPVFLDSDDLVDLRLLTNAVLNSDAIVLLQSANVFTRPWCLIELVTALDHRVPIVCVSLETGKHRYDFETASRFLTALHSELDNKNSGASATLAKHGVDVHDAAWKLSCTLPAIISVAFNPSAS